MSLFTRLFIILNFTVAITTRNLEPTKDTYYKDKLHDYITFKDSLNKFYIKTADSEFVTVPVILKNNEGDLVEFQEIKSRHKTKRSAIEENKMSLVLPKPIRRVRHRGSTLKQDEYLKFPHFKTVNKTIDKTDLNTDEVMKSNTNAYTLKERNDNAIKKTNDTTIHLILGDEMENGYLDINKDILIRSMGSYPKNVLEIARLSNDNIAVNYTQSSSYIAGNDNTKSMGIIDMPSKYISVVKDPKTMILNTKSEITTINNQTLKEKVNSQEEIIETHDTEVIAEQYNHEELMKSNDAGIIAGQYNSKYHNIPNMKSIEINERIKHITPRFDLQKLMERNRAGILAEQHNEEDQNQPNMKSLEAGRHIHRKLIGERSTFEQEPMERKKFKIEEEQYDKDQNQEIKILASNGHINQKLLESRPRFDHQGLIGRNDSGIIAGPYYNENLNRPNTKSMDINGHLRHIRPKLNHQELMERKGDIIEEEHFKKDLNQSHMKTMDSSGYIYQKSLEPKARSDHQELMETNDAEFKAGHYGSHQDPPEMKFLETNGRNNKKISDATPSLDYQELMERYSAGTLAEQYSKGDPNQQNIKSFKSNEHNISQKLFEARPRLIKEEDNNIIETEQNKRVPNELNMKSLKIGNPNTNQNLLGAIVKSELQNIEEESDSKMLSEQYYEEYSNQLNMNYLRGNANIDEPVFQDIGKPEKELMGRNNAEIVAKYKEDLFATNTNAKDTSNSNMDQKLTEAVRSEPELTGIKNAETRHGIAPEKYKEHSSQPNINYLDMNANYHHSSFEEINDKLINLDQKEVIGVVYPRLVHYIPRIQPLVVIPRFGCRLVPSCSRFYLPKRCPKFKMKCGLI